MRYTNLQAGRFLAAGTVLVFHAACHGQQSLGVSSPLVAPVPAYWLCTAVVFFFALSGFVLAHGLQTARLGAFLRGRLLRLYPAFWAAAGLVFAVRWLAGPPVPCDGRGVLYALTLWPCGPNRAAYPLGIEWTLVYEVFLSIALIPLAAVGRRWGLGIGAAGWLIALIGWQVWTDGQPRPPFPTVRELPLSVLNAPFLLGVLVYLGRSYLTHLRALLPLLAYITLVAGADRAVSAPGWSYLLQAVGTAAAVGFFAGGQQLGERNPLVRAGDWSYGIYLLHVPVMTGFYALVAWFEWRSPEVAVWVGGGLALVMSAGYGAAEWAVYRRLRRKRPADIRPVPAMPFRRRRENGTGFAWFLGRPDRRHP